MKLRSTRLTAVALGAVAMIALSGCVTSAPPAIQTAAVSTATATPSVTPTPTPTPVPTMIVLSAHGLSVQTADHTSLGEISYETDIAMAATQLAAATGEQPVVTSHSPGPCSDAKTPSSFDTYTWGGLYLYQEFSSTGPQKFFVAASLGKTATGLDLVAPNNVRIGAKLADVLANSPGAVKAENSGVILDAQNDPKYGPWGVVLSADHPGGAIVAFFNAPSYGIAKGGC